MTNSPAPLNRFGHVLLAMALCVGTWLRLRGIGTQALFGDELHSLAQASSSLGEILTHFDARGSHVVLPLLQHWSMQLFGDGLLAFRLVAIVPGLLTLYLIYPIGRGLVGRTPALLACLALALSPMHIYYSQYARSYALSACLGMLLVYFLARALEGDGKPGMSKPWIASFVLVGVLPYVHLSSAGFVGTAVLIAIVCVCVRTKSLKVALWPMLGFGLALLLCLAAYAPIIDQVQSYLNHAMPEQLKKSPSGLAGIWTLLAGGATAALCMLVMVPMGLIGIGRKRAPVALLMAATFVGPGIALLLTKPHGMEYAYARYMLTALPFLPMAMAWALHALAQKLRSNEAQAAGLSMGLGAFMIGAGFVTGPSFGARPKTTVFDNSYLAMHALPAFDLAWPELHPFYATLAAEAETLRIVEFPVLQTRAALFYRQAAFVHGKEVLLGVPWDPMAGMGKTAYVSIASASSAEADYIILHRNPVAEVQAYWDFVYEQAGPESEWGLETGFLRRQRAHLADQEITREDYLASEAARLKKRLGPAFYKDPQILVWKLKP